jgi:hypothetical protein
VTRRYLARQPAGTQLALAEAIRYDKTRLIGLLDELERDGLITRKPDPTSGTSGTRSGVKRDRQPASGEPPCPAPS